MLLTPLVTVVLAALAPFVAAQDDTQGDIVYDLAHNATTIYGTWSSQSNAVTTGPDFVDPTKLTFNYPSNTGVSYSFTEDGFYEISRYRFNSNGSEPTCIQGVIAWAHGTYTLNSNGSIWMHPFGDGFQQIQDPCAAVSNFIETFNVTEYYKGWRIFNDPTTGYKLHLYLHDGAPVAPQYLRSTTPTMHPTRPLRNDTWVRVDSKERRSLDTAQDGSAPASRPLAGVAAAGALALVFASVFL